ncbi:hypothetical protein [Mesorhizobium opportunistum]|uniref:Uncharacterized protein n=1 Tax=Mesorhizobium opportunistum (strain LMG 24607 / HAMBI 3007 / WSM2075) TaxID=536019 RepID=F7Y1B7_MESOW|nr:hypothetical protein [Mesorhizobium opportunistum]AEH89402.1 hypothetical protein Mesop_4982 [Mesorhizobium opportunistum WSM2075]
MRRTVLLLSVLFSTPGLVSASAEEKWPSIIYFGEKTNERVTGPLYWDGQAGLLAQQRLREQSGSAATGYGAISEITGNPRTTRVAGYTKANGTRVTPYYRSRR